MSADSTAFTIEVLPYGLALIGEVRQEQLNGTNEPAQPPSRSQPTANSAIVVTNVFMDPDNIRVHLTIDPGRPTDVFPFQFDRHSHDTVEKLLQSVENVFKAGHDDDVNVEELARRRLIMHMFKKGAPTIGGNVKDDHDLAGIKGVRGTGWYGQMEIE